MSSNIDSNKSETPQHQPYADMVMERDLPVPMEDGVILRADVYRPKTTEKAPVILTMGPYGKGVKYQEGFAASWNWLISRYPDILGGSTGSYLTLGTVDPELWVPAGYAVLRVDSRGSGRSPGILDILSRRQATDLYNCIEWAGVQPWSSGKVGLCGVSYYAINQWLVATLHPPHLTCMIPWEGAADFYRDITHHGGIYSNVFLDVYSALVSSIQHGLGTKGPTDHWMKQPASGPETLDQASLIGNRSGFVCNIKKHQLDDEFHKSRTPDFSKITVPFLSAANWGAFGLHQRGNFEGFTQSKSRQKWLEVHGGRHPESFYLKDSVKIQMRFFDYFLKGEKNGWDKEPPVILTIRYVDHFETRKEAEWPLQRTRWTKVYLDAKNCSLKWVVPPHPGKVRFEALGDGVTFASPPLERQTEITGPMAARLFVSSSTTDADLFLTFRAFDTSGKEVDFQGANDPHTPLAQGWLRASHRRLSPRRSNPYRPYHTHERKEPLKPGAVYILDIEVWATCVVLPARYTIALTVQGKDFQRPTWQEEWGGVPLRGSGPFLHNDPDDRPVSVYSGKTQIFTGKGRSSFLLLPIISDTARAP